MRGPISFVQAFVIDSSAWIPLLFAFLAGAVAFFTSPTRPQFARDLQARFLGTSVVENAPKLDETTHGVGAAVGGMMGRIIVMHLTILIGAFFAAALGTAGALMFLVAIKIVIDLKLHLKNDFPEKAKPQVA